MDEPKFAEELRKMQVEPLLPAEKKLVLWSVLSGLILIVVLAVISRVFFKG